MPRVPKDEFDHLKVNRLYFYRGDELMSAVYEFLSGMREAERKKWIAAALRNQYLTECEALSRVARTPELKYSERPPTAWSEDQSGKRAMPVRDRSVKRSEVDLRRRKIVRTPSPRVKVSKTPAAKATTPHVEVVQKRPLNPSGAKVSPSLFSNLIGKSSGG